MIILSFDCAYRSLAWAYLRFDNLMHVLAESRDIVRAVSAGAATDDIAANNANLTYRCSQQKMISLIAANANDIIGNKLAKTSHIDRARALHRHLRFLDSTYTRPDLVVIERQPSGLAVAANTHSLVVQQQILYHYITAGIEVVFVNPKQKNIVSLCPAASSLAAIFGSAEEKTAAKYRARKKHSVANLAEIARVFDMDINHIPHAMIDDVADAIMQAIVYWAGLQ